MAIKTCSVPGCEKPAAFGSTKRPAYCHEHINTIFNAVGLELLEPFEKPDDYYLTRCLTCDEKLHYRFKYLLDSRGYPKGEKICRVCFWRNWYRERRSPSSFLAARFLTYEEAETESAKRNADLVKILPGEYPGEDLYITRCRGCGLLSVERHPTNHDKCRPLKARMVESVSVIPAASPLAAVPEKTYPVTENQR